MTRVSSTAAACVARAKQRRAFAYVVVGRPRARRRTPRRWHFRSETTVSPRRAREPFSFTFGANVFVNTKTPISVTRTRTAVLHILQLRNLPFFNFSSSSLTLPWAIFFFHAVFPHRSLNIRRFQCERILVLYSSSCKTSNDGFRAGRRSSTNALVRFRSSLISVGTRGRTDEKKNVSVTRY